MQNFNDSNFNKSSNFCNSVCGKLTSIGAAIFILTLNHADEIGDQSDAVTQNAWFLCALCAAISGEISILIQTGAESWGRFPVPRICRWESKVIYECMVLLRLFESEPHNHLIVSHECFKK